MSLDYRPAVAPGQGGAADLAMRDEFCNHFHDAGR